MIRHWEQVFSNHAPNAKMKHRLRGVKLDMNRRCIQVPGDVRKELGNLFREYLNKAYPEECKSMTVCVS